MLERIISGWSVIRAIYVLAGLGIVVQGVMDKQWFVTVFGIYFASMGIFNFGCAGGACYVPNRKYSKSSKNFKPKDVNFEEVKTENK